MRNPNLQCLNCGTHLLPDGTCPRCSPVSSRPPDEKLAIGTAWGDKRIVAQAHREIEAMETAAGRPSTTPHRWAGPPDVENLRNTSRVPTEEEIEAEVERRIAERDAAKKPAP